VVHFFENWGWHRFAVSNGMNRFRFAILLIVLWVRVSGAQTLDPRIYDADKQDDLKQLRAWKSQIEEVINTNNSPSRWVRLTRSQYGTRLSFPEDWLRPPGKSPNVQYGDSYKFAKDHSPVLSFIEEVINSETAKKRCFRSTCYLEIDSDLFQQALRLIEEKLNNAVTFNYCVLQEMNALSAQGSGCTQTPIVTVRGYRVENDCTRSREDVQSIPQRYRSCYYSNRFFTHHCVFIVKRSYTDSLGQFYYAKKAGNSEMKAFPDREMAFEAMLADPTCH
jgi:hypothetical protein